MPCRSKKVRNNISRTDRLIQLNRNACNQTRTNINSHIESIGNLIIDELKGSERDHLKQQLLTSCMSNTTTTNNNLPVSSSRRNLKQLLTDLHTFDCHIQRQYRTIGIGDNDVNANISTTNTDKLDITTEQTNNTNMLNDESEIPRVSKRKTKEISSVNPSQTTKKTPNIITRTICTRSSKLNNNQELFNYILPNRTRKRRSSLINNIDTSTQINNNNHLNLNKPTSEEVSNFKLTRKKRQSSVPYSTTVECLNTTNDF